MIFATLKDQTADGQLVVVSLDRKRFLPLERTVKNLLSALEDWDTVQPVLSELTNRLAAGEGLDLKMDDCIAPMPRSWQWLDGSAFSTHGHLLQVAFGLDPIESDRPLMYQGMSDRFIGPTDDVPFPSVEHGIDFEGEYGVIVDDVPMGTCAADAMKHIKLIVQINDGHFGRLPRSK